MSPGKRARAADVSRRQRTRRLDLTTVLAVVLPVLTAGALTLVHPLEQPTTSHPPALTALSRSVVVCPGAQPVSPTALVGSATGAAGTIGVGSGSDQHDVRLSANAATEVSGDGALVIRGRDRTAPGLVAGRYGTAKVSGTSCLGPASDQWFTGLGARVDHDSVVELVNPDPGPAVADFTLLSPKRTFTVRRLRGLTIPGHRTLTLDLAKVVPRRLLLTAHVVISRGRLAVDVLDSVTDLRTDKTTSEWLPPQLLPSTDNRLIGLPQGRGTRTLQLTNGTDDVVRAQVKIMTGDTAFVPEGLAPSQLLPGTTTRIDLTKVLATALRDGAVGVEVQSTGAVTTSVVTQQVGDRAITTPAVAFSEQAALTLPGSVRADLLLSADAAGAGVVDAYASSGRRLLHRVVGEQQGRTLSLRLPRGTTFVRVSARRTPLRGAVVLSGAGSAVIPLGELPIRGLVPQIVPGQE